MSIRQLITMFIIGATLAISGGLLSDLTEIHCTGAMIAVFGMFVMVCGACVAIDMAHR